MTVTFAPANAERTAQLALPGWALRALGALLFAGVLLNVAGGVLYGKLLRDSLALHDIRDENIILREQLAKLRSIESELRGIEETRQRLYSIAGVPATEADLGQVMSDEEPHPADGRISSPEESPFEQTPFLGPISRGFARKSAHNLGHEGCDIAGREGAPVVAAAAGVVTFSGWDSTFGNLLILQHVNGWSSHYGHNEAVLVGQGDTVTVGQKVSFLGSTGKSTAPHLHFEIYRFGKSKDPAMFFPEYRAN